MANSTARVAPRALADTHIVNAEPFSMSESTARLGRIAILWRGDEAASRSATADTGRFKAVFAALADVGVDAEPVVYEDNVLDAVRAQLATVDGVLVWVNPIHEGRNRANLDALLREVAGRGVWVSAHPDVILKMGTKEVLHRTRTMSWGSDTALYRTAEAMRVELSARLAAGPRVIKRKRGNGGQGVWKVETLASPRNRPMIRVLDATKDASEELASEPRRHISEKRRIADPTKRCNHHRRIVAVCCPELGEFIQ